MNTKSQIYKLGATFVSIICTRPVMAKDTWAIIDELRHISDKVSIQAIDASVIYGTEHLIEVLKITLESKRRKIMLSKRPETDLLLRLSFTNQISVALKYAGIKNHANCCFVIFAKDKKELLKISCCVDKLFKADSSVLRPDTQKKEMISHTIGLTSSSPLLNNGDFAFMRFILERSCLVTR